MMEIRRVPLSELNPARYNPRRDLQPGDSDYESLKKSLLAFDLVEPLVWNERTGNLVGGHQRLKVLRELGHTEVDVSVVDLPVAREKALNLALNRIQGEWDLPKLKDLLQEIDTGEFDMAITGFSEREIENLMAQFYTPNEGLTDADEIPGKVEAICRVGDLWQLGKHRLLCGDATNLEDMQRLMGGEKAAMAWTDPPYGVSYGEKLTSANPMGYRVRSITNDNLPAGELKTFLHSALVNMALVGNPGMVIYWACPAGTLILIALSAFDGSGFAFKWGLVWIKDQLVLGRGDYHFRHENILYGWKTDGPHYFIQDRTQDSVFEVPRPKRSEEHPTMKPVELVAKMVANSSKLGDCILDPFGGSGTTLIACEKLNRQCRMMEIEPSYCDVIIQRWQNFTGQQAEKVNA